MEHEAFGDLLSDAHDRIEMARRILEDHADAPAAHLLHLLFAQRGNVSAFKEDAALGDGEARPSA